MNNEMMDRASFWQMTEANPPRPLETAVSKLDPTVASDFARGGLEIYNAVALVNPDVIFFPERGAAPFRWIVEALEEVNGRSFYKVPLMIGTETEVGGDTQHGQTRPVKRLNIRRGLETARSQVPNLERPMLIDEVQLGGTIKIASQYLLQELRDAGFDVPIYIVAVQDTTGEIPDKKRARGYKTLISNTRPGFRAAVVNMELFHMDNQIFLNHELVDYEGHANGSNPMPMLMHNTESEQFIKNIILAYIQPDSLQAALDSIEGRSKDELSSQAIMLRGWIQSFLNSLNSNSWVDKEDALEWFRNFLHESRKDSSGIPALIG